MNELHDFEVFVAIDIVNNADTGMDPRQVVHIAYTTNPLRA